MTLLTPSLTMRLDTVTPEIQRLAREAQRPRAIMAAGGRAISNFLKKHFRGLHASNPNKLGGTRQNFWLQIMRAVQNPQITDTTASVAVSDVRYAQKVFGGTIVAKRAKMLTIPVSKDAYGRAASVLAQEKGITLVAIGHAGRGVLAEVRPDKSIIVHYVLRPSVTQEPFEGALPDMNALGADALQHARNAAARLVKSA